MLRLNVEVESVRAIYTFRYTVHVGLVWGIAAAAIMVATNTNSGQSNYLHELSESPLADPSQVLSSLTLFLIYSLPARFRESESHHWQSDQR